MIITKVNAAGKVVTLQQTCLKQYRLENHAQLPPRKHHVFIAVIDGTDEADENVHSLR